MQLTGNAVIKRARSKKGKTGKVGKVGKIPLSKKGEISPFSIFEKGEKSPFSKKGEISPFSFFEKGENSPFSFFEKGENSPFSNITLNMAYWKSWTMDPLEPWTLELWTLFFISYQDRY